MQSLYGKANSQSCHKLVKEKQIKLLPPKTFHNVSGKVPQLNMWTTYYKNTLNCYSKETVAKEISLNETGGDRLIPFTFQDIKKITECLEPKKSYKYNIHWKFAPTSALLNLYSALISFWLHGENVGFHFFQVNMMSIPKSQDKDLTVLKCWGL